MRPFVFRCAILFSLALVVAPDLLPVFEPAEAEAAPRRRGRRASRSQSARARNARNRQQARLRTRRAASLNRARVAAANRARMNAYARTNPNQYGPGGAPAAGTPAVVNRDVHFQMSEKLSVGSLIPTGKTSSFETIAPGQTVTVTVYRDKGDTGAATTQSATLLGQVTGKVVSVKNETVKELVLRVSSYQYGAAKDEDVPIVPGQQVTAVLIRTQPQGVAGLFKQ